MTKIEMGRKYRTRDGREVRIYAVDHRSPVSVAGAILQEDGEWMAATWFPTGECSKMCETLSDLIEVRPRIKREVWVNVYPSDRRYGCHSSRIGAYEGGTADRIACVKLTIDCEEGEGLD